MQKPYHLTVFLALILFIGCESTTAVRYQETPSADIPERFMTGSGSGEQISMMSPALTRDQKTIIAGSKLHIALRAYTPPLVHAWAQRYVSRAAYYKHWDSGKQAKVKSQFVKTYSENKLCFSIQFWETDPWLVHNSETWKATLKTKAGKKYPLTLVENTLPKIVVGSEAPLLACANKQIDTSNAFSVILTSKIGKGKPTNLAFKWGISRY